MRSSTTRSGENDLTTLTAAPPVETHSTSYPSKPRLSRRTRAIAASSSTTRIRFFIVSPDWKGHTHRRTDVDSTTDVKTPSVIGHDALHDGESETAAVRDEVTAAEEAPRHVLDLIGGDSAPPIGHVHHDGAVLAARGDGDRFGAGRVPDRVVDQVVEHQPHRGSIGPHQRNVRGDVHVYFEPRLGELVLKILHRVLDERLERERLERVDLGHVGDSRQREQVVNQARQPLRLLHYHLRIFAPSAG